MAGSHFTLICETAYSPLRGRWLLWSFVVVLWTVGLLTPYPVQAGSEIMTPETAFPTAKGLHILVYAGLMLGVVWLRLGRFGSAGLVGFLVLHAASTEFLQNYVPSRTGTVRDVLLDWLGIVLGMLVCWRLRSHYAK